ncbi:MAG: sulfite exporter TauE/SafE family protein [Paracoccaceae bacterium]
MEDSFALFAVVGFLAQLIDGALGMAYGVVSSTVLLSFGVSPATASASVHAAELFTTAASSGSHIWHKNVNWRLFRLLAPAGIAGGLVGTYVLTSFDPTVLKPYVAGYLALMGAYILYRAFRRAMTVGHHSAAVVVPLGAIGGTLDAIGGGGWGPIVTTGLVGAGGTPREVIGTVNTAEFLLTVAVSMAFLTAALTGHWQDADNLNNHLSAIGGLIVGGVLAAPLAGYVTRLVPSRQLMILVGVLISLVAAYQTWRLL